MSKATSYPPDQEVRSAARRRWTIFTVLLAYWSGSWAVAALASDSTEPSVNFAESIRPIFVRRCARCHGADRQKGGLRLDRKNAALRGGESGALLVPGKSSDSLLIKRLTASDADERMPAQADPLPPGEIDLLRRWINQGAHWPSSGAKDSAALASDHWSFRPIQSPAPPQVRGQAWVGDPIDRFILTGLEGHQVSPSPEADRPTLIRRLTLDLIGLPPTPDEVQDFVQDASPEAYERLVDRLLASPHFGERWGGHWLDLARYADSDGYEQDDPRPFAYRWRDWVIQAVNADIPFDQFTIEQLAGDLLPGATKSQILATGFHRNAAANREGGVDKEEARVQAITDRVNTTGTIWLGLTVACAECHSHKFDPLSQAEYYQLFAFLNEGVDEVDAATIPTVADRRQHALAVKAYGERVASLRARWKEATPDERMRIERSLKTLEKKGPPRLDAQLAVFGPASRSRQTHIHLGGDFTNRGPRVGPGVPAMLPALVSRHHDGTPADRLDLARWLVDPSNPLTSRVEANRIWQHLFGSGIVATPDDFGTQGEPPSHPALLDHLATRLIQSGWSRKALIRAIVHTATYRQQSAHRSDVDAMDPTNRWVHRQNRFRLEAEIVRDVTLAAAGLLNRTQGGPGVRPPVPESFKSFSYRFQWIEDPSAERYRRGIYIFFQRNMIFPCCGSLTDRTPTSPAYVAGGRTHPYRRSRS
jgi:hypothetical protein